MNIVNLIRDIKPRRVCIHTKDAEHWITLKNGEHVQVNEHGEVVAGAGGNLNGQKLDVKSKSAAIEPSQSSGMSEKDKHELAKSVSARTKETHEQSRSKIEELLKKPENHAKLSETLNQLRSHKEASIVRVKSEPNEEGAKINPGQFLWEKDDNGKSTRINAHLTGSGSDTRKSVNLRVDNDGEWELSALQNGLSKPHTATGEGGEKEAMRHLPDFVKKAVNPERYSTSYMKRELTGFGPAQGGISYEYATGKAKQNSSLPAYMNSNNTTAAKEQAANVESGKTYLKVPFAEKEEAKKHGARWNPDKKQWYFSGSQLPEGLKKWAHDHAFDSMLEIVRIEYTADQIAVIEND